MSTEKSSGADNAADRTFIEPQVISFNETERFDRGEFSGQVYVDGEASMGFNALAIFVNGRHPRKKMGENTCRTYLVVQGGGAFEFGRQRVRAVKEGDLVVIPAEAEYSYAGEMLLWEMNISPDNSFQDQKLE